MASACIRTMTLGQNIHIMPQNCVIIASQNCLPVSQANHYAMQPGKTPIAPAPPSASGSKNSMTSGTTTTTVLGMNGVNVQSNDGPRYKKKYTYANMPYGEQPPSVARRNARERNRVKQVNNGFANLRQHIPQTIITTLTNGGRGASKKLSKVDTLRLAVEYIRRLQELLDEADSDTASTNTLNSQGSVNSSSSYYSTSPDHFSIAAPCSEASSSPTPSYSSDLSIGSNNYVQSQAQFKFEPYDSYNSIRPEDEELLDYISSWQEQ